MKGFKSLLFATSLSALVAMSACATATPAPPSNEGKSTTQSTAPAAKKKIQAWSWWGSEARKPVISHLIEYFNQNSTTTEVEYVYTPYGDIFTKNLASIAAGNPANVIFGPIEDAAFRASNNQTENLKPFMDRDGFSIDQYAKLYTTGVEYEGGIYGIPFVVDTRMVFYNKDHMDSIGYDHSSMDKMPQTWDELIALSKKLDIKTGNKYDRIGFLPLFGSGGWGLWLTNADGLGFYDAKAGKPAINTPIKLDVVKRIMEIHDYYGDDVVNEMTSAQSAGMQNVFGSGKISMTINNTTYAKELKNDFPELNWGTFLIPEYEAGTGHYSNGGGFVIEMPKGAKDQDNGWEFIKYMGSAYAQKYWSTNCFELSALLELADDADLKADPVYSTALIMANSTTLALVPLEMNGYMDIVNSYLDQVKARSMKPEDALKNAEKEVNDLISRQKK